ncbi:MAG: histidine kinase [Chitinophagaceae bacterium]
MKEVLKKSVSFNRIEFWAITTIWVFLLFFFITDGLDGNSSYKYPFNRQLFEKAHVPYNYFTHYFIPQLIRFLFLYMVLVYMNFLVIPRILERKMLMLQVFLIFLSFWVSVFVFGSTDTYLRGYLYPNAGGRYEVNLGIYRHSFVISLKLLLVLFFYSVIKYTGIHLLSRASVLERKYQFVTREAIVATIVWTFGLLLLVASGAPMEVVVGWMILVPTGMMIFLLNYYWLIPRALKRKYSFLVLMGQNAVILFVVFGLFSILIIIAVKWGDDGVSLSLFNSVFNFFITVPLTWVIYRRQVKGRQVIDTLKMELGQSNANFDFLRSQINPHFLFNALNTIYGTAIQENAERTGGAVLKLSDMMRFMLQENMQETIPLMREVEYLNNYLSLQKLRTATSPDIRIQTDIESTVLPIRVAPMLFIPFVENAFKHGISFREPSYISITLAVKNGVVNFDVFNSKHKRAANDPEADKSGIGLNNVRQRLQLLYPGKHELVIRETANDFFVHLSIQSV